MQTGSNSPCAKNKINKKQKQKNREGLAGEERLTGTNRLHYQLQTLLVQKIKYKETNKQIGNKKNQPCKQVRCILTHLVSSSF